MDLLSVAAVSSFCVLFITSHTYRNFLVRIVTPSPQYTRDASTTRKPTVICHSLREIIMIRKPARVRVLRRDTNSWVSRVPINVGAEIVTVGTVNLSSANAPLFLQEKPLIVCTLSLIHSTWDVSNLSSRDHLNHSNYHSNIQTAMPIWGAATRVDRLWQRLQQLL